MQNLLFIFLGGGLGAVARYGLSLWVYSLQASKSPPHFPFGILCCNLIGCFLIGMTYGWVKSTSPAWISPLAVTGFLGGFTTFSTFALDSQKLFQANAPSHAILYIAATLLGGLAACALGWRLTR